MADALAQKILNVFVAALIGVVVIGVLLGVGSYLGTGDTDVEYPVTAQPETVDAAVRDVPGDVQVRATTERSLRLNGTAVEAEVPAGVDDGGWGAALTADFAGNENATYNALAYNDTAILVQRELGDWAAIFDNGTHSARVEVPAGSGLESVAAWSDGSDLSMSTSDDYAEAPLTTSDETRNVSWDWNGRLEEVRLFSSPLDNQTADAYIDDPVQPLPGTDREARMMFDEGPGSSSTRVYFADTRATVPGDAEWADGVGNPRKWFGLSSAIEEGDDYELQEDPFSIVVTQGGYLEGAPVVHVSWSGLGFLSIDIIGLMTLFIALLILLPLAKAVIAYQQSGGRI